MFEGGSCMSKPPWCTGATNGPFIIKWNPLVCVLTNAMVCMLARTWHTGVCTFSNALAMIGLVRLSFSLVVGSRVFSGLILYHHLRYLPRALIQSVLSCPRKGIRLQFSFLIFSPFSSWFLTPGPNLVMSDLWLIAVADVIHLPSLLPYICCLRTRRCKRLRDVQDGVKLVQIVGLILYMYITCGCTFSHYKLRIKMKGYACMVV